MKEYLHVFLILDLDGGKESFPRPVRGSFRTPSDRRPDRLQRRSGHSGKEKTLQPLEIDGRLLGPTTRSLLKRLRFQ